VSGSNFVQAAINSLRSGDSAEATSESLGVEVVDSSSVSASDSIEDSDEMTADGSDESGDTGVDSSDSSVTSGGKAPADKKSASGDSGTSAKEVITISDETGRKKIEIDYSDRAAIKRAHELAYGSRKWQAERDRASQERDGLKQRLEKVEPVLEALEKAFSERGELGVIDLIAGKHGASEAFIKRQVERAKFLEKASPEEVEALRERERLEKLERDHQKLREENETFKKSVAEKEESAALRSTEATVHPVFEKYRFADKLGDENDEAMFDEMLWNTALKRLKPYEDQGLELSRELVDREFRQVASALRKRINVQAEKRAAAAVTQKKQEATENAQASTMSAYKKGGARAEAQDLINKGDFRNLFSNWGKYGKSMNKK